MALRQSSANSKYDLIMVSPHITAGGVPYKARKLVDHWETNGKSILVTSLKTDPHNHPFEDYPSLVSLSKSNEPNVGLKKYWASLSRLLQLRKLIKQNPTARVFALGHHANTLSVIASIGVANQVFVSHFSDPLRNPTKTLLARVMNRANRHAHLNIVNTQGGAEVLQSRNPQTAYAVIPNYLKTNIRPRSMENKLPHIMATGRLVDLKSHHLMIDAFNMIAQQFSDWKLILLGEGANFEKLAQQISRSPEPQRIELLGHKKDVTPYLNEASIFIQFSEYEGLASSLMEAMVYGCACITGDSSPGPLELISDKQTGLVAAYPDIKSLSHAMKELIESPELRNSLSENAQQHIKIYDEAAGVALWDQHFWGKAFPQ